MASKNFIAKLPSAVVEAAAAAKKKKAGNDFLAPEKTIQVTVLVSNSGGFGYCDIDDAPTFTIDNKATVLEFRKRVHSYARLHSSYRHNNYAPDATAKILPGLVIQGDKYDSLFCEDEANVTLQEYATRILLARVCYRCC